jgi:polyisoprenoid-binding protein YceI
MMLSRVTGHFTRFEGKVNFNPDIPAECSATGSIQVASIDTRDSSRDRHLVGPDFFDASSYPVISFASKKFQFESATSFILDGELTMHGVSKPVSLQCKVAAIEKAKADQKSKLKLIAKTRILRKDFGLMWNAAIEAGGVLVGDEIEIKLELEFQS